MAFLDLFRKAPAQKPSAELSRVAAAVGTGKATTKRGSAELLLAYRESPWLRSVCGRIAQAVASNEWELYVGDKQIEEHPFFDMLERGNTKLSGASCMEVTQLHIDLLGEAFWVIDTNAVGAPYSYWPIPPSWVSATPTDAQAFFDMKIRGAGVKIPADKVLWFKTPDPADPYARGVGAGESLGDEIDTDEYAAAFLKTFFYNGAAADGVVSIKGATEAQVRDVETRWNAKMRGTNNAHRMAFTSAEVDVKLLSQGFKDMAIVELRRSLRDNVIHAFGVPPEVLGVIDNSNRATIDAAETLFAKFVLVPRLDRIRAGLQDLAKRFDEKLLVWYVSPVPADREFQLKTMSAAPTAFTVAEWRQLAGMEARPGDEVAFAPFSTPAPNMPELAPPPAPAKSLRRKTPAIVIDDLVGVWEGLSAVPLNTKLTPIIGQQMQVAGAAELASLGLSMSFNMLNPLVTDHIALFVGDKIKGINDTTKEDLRRTLVEGVEAGEGYKDLAERVSDVFADAQGYRAEMIARTEAVGSQNAATYSADVQSGVVSHRQWIATPDDRTRDEHTALNGQVRAIDEEFEVDGYSALYPGGFGAGEMDINCRCTTGAVRNDEAGAPVPLTTEALAEVWKAYDKRLLAWERKYKRGAREAFRIQEAQALADLKAAVG